MDKNAAIIIANNAEAASKQLGTVAKINETIERLLANPKSEIFLREKMSHIGDNMMRESLVLKPNASKPRLIRLAAQFPWDLDHNFSN